MAEGDEVTSAGDPVVIPATRTTVDSNGNTVVTGYAPDGTEIYTGDVRTEPEEAIFVDPNVSEGA